MKDSAVAEIVIGRLKEKNPQTRKSAAMALGKISDSRAVEPLIEALKEKDAQVNNNCPGGDWGFPGRRAVD